MSAPPRPRSDAAQGVVVLAPAKINLFLHVGEKRDDGYHAIESLAVFTAAADRVAIAPAGGLTLHLKGPFADRLRFEPGNLVLKAAQALLRARPGAAPGARIVLEKNLPVAAGLGGGSADAAAALRGLNALFALALSEEDLLRIAASIGSDVPACVLSRPCFMEGRGERVTATPSVPPLPLVLVNPGVHVPMAKVFAALNARSGIGAMSPPRSGLRNLWDLIAYLDRAGNDLEAPACGLAPVIEDVLAALDREPGCALAQMSGSGATCFGLFHDPQFAAGAAERIAWDHRDWWVRATSIARADIGVPVRSLPGAEPDASPVPDPADRSGQ